MHFGSIIFGAHTSRGLSCGLYIFLAFLVAYTIFDLLHLSHFPPSLVFRVFSFGVLKFAQGLLQPVMRTITGGGEGGVEGK